MSRASIRDHQTCRVVQKSDIARGMGWAFAFNVEHDDNMQTGIMFMGSRHDESATGEKLDTVGAFLEAGLLEYQRINHDLRIRYSGLIGLGGMAFDFSDAYSDELEWAAEVRLSMGLEFKHTWLSIGGGGIYAGEFDGQDHAEGIFVNLEIGYTF
ncbi:hypothetical protein BVY04_03800 [bacterium M21]|nr:hypothetical protein BVY04_03800 [bacterium M21]